MKMILLTLCTLLILSMAVGVNAADKADKAKKETKEKKAKSAPKEGKGDLLHVVAFKYKASATEAQIKEVGDAFANLKKTIKQIKNYEAGTNVSPENHAKGFTHGFILTFKSSKDRDDYLVHPDHKAFGALLGPIIEDVFVIDFWTE